MVPTKTKNETKKEIRFIFLLLLQSVHEQSVHETFPSSLLYCDETPLVCHKYLLLTIKRVKYLLPVTTNAFSIAGTGYNPEAVFAGKRAFDSIAIATNSSPPAAPCGVCRQALAEFGINLKVILVNPDGERREFELTELLPQAFTPDLLASSETAERGRK